MKSFLSLAVPAVILLIALGLGVYLLVVDVRELGLCAAAKMHYQDTGMMPGSWADLEGVETLIRHPDGFAYELDCDGEAKSCTIRWTETRGQLVVPMSRECGSMGGWDVGDFY
jgi:YD repeat-containing protein